MGGRVLRAAGQQQQVGGRLARGQRSRGAVEAAAGSPACRGRAAAAAGERTSLLDPLARATLELLPAHVLSVLRSPTGCMISTDHFPEPWFRAL